MTHCCMLGTLEGKTRRGPHCRRVHPIWWEAIVIDMSGSRSSCPSRQEAEGERNTGAQISLFSLLQPRTPSHGRLLPTFRVALLMSCELVCKLLRDMLRSLSPKYSGFCQVDNDILYHEWLLIGKERVKISFIRRNNYTFKNYRKDVGSNKQR